MNYKEYQTIDVFHQSDLQEIIMGLNPLKTSDVLIINKIKQNDAISDSFIDQYQKLAQNLIKVEKADQDLVLISTYEKSELLEEFLNRQKYDFKERTRYCKSFLSKVEKYMTLAPPYQDLLIDQDQLTVQRDIISFSNYLILDHYNQTIDQQYIYQKISQIMTLILQLHKEALSDKRDDLMDFLDDIRKGKYQTLQTIQEEFNSLLKLYFTKDKKIPPHNQEADAYQLDINPAFEDDFKSISEDIKSLEDNEEAIQLIEEPEEEPLIIYQDEQTDFINLSESLEEIIETPSKEIPFLSEEQTYQEKKNNSNEVENIEQDIQAAFEEIHNLQSSITASSEAGIHASNLKETIVETPLKEESTTKVTPARTIRRIKRLPLFILFLIVLVTLSALLLYYTSTYI